MLNKRHQKILIFYLVAEAEAQQEADALRIVENSMASVSREHKEVFMIVYQKFTRVLQELITSNADVESSWTYKWVFGWYRETLRVVNLNTNMHMSTGITELIILVVFQGVWRFHDYFGDFGIYS